VTTGVETPKGIRSLSNSRASIEERLAAGRVPWLGPVLLVCARTVLWFTTQWLPTLILFGLHRPDPVHTARDWWMFCGTFGDFCCLLGMRHFTRREGIRLSDLIGPIRLRYGRDLFFGLGILLLSYPLFTAGNSLAAWAAFGTPSAAKLPMAFLLQAHRLPLWATAYTLTVWWPIQSATEEMTYLGYALPRIQALSGRTWVATTIVGFFWAAQHCMVPFVPDWRFLTFRLLMMLPALVAAMLLYLRIRRLPPLIVAHWPMDFGVAIMTGLH
jgi:hypothetical protein